MSYVPALTRIYYLILKTLCWRLFVFFLYYVFVPQLLMCSTVLPLAFDNSWRCVSLVSDIFLSCVLSAEHGEYMLLLRFVSFSLFFGNVLLQFRTSIPTICCQSSPSSSRCKSASVNLARVRSQLVGDAIRCSSISRAAAIDLDEYVTTLRLIMMLVMTAIYIYRWSWCSPTITVEQ